MGRPFQYGTTLHQLVGVDEKFDRFPAFIILCVCSAAPGVPPPDLITKAVSYDTVQIVWGEIPCIKRNGLITGYVINVSLDGEVVTSISSVGSSTNTTVSSLLPLRTYSVSVAALSDQGTGPLSSPVLVTTPLTGT